MILIIYYNDGKEDIQEKYSDINKALKRRAKLDLLYSGVIMAPSFAND